MGPKTLLRACSARPSSIPLLSSACTANTSRSALSPLLSRYARTFASPSPSPSSQQPTTPAPSKSQPTQHQQQQQEQEEEPPLITLPPPGPPKFGTVISAGLMSKTVRVIYKHQTYDKNLHKHYPTSTVYLVADPRDSLREGDVIEFVSGWRASRNVRHVVERIVAPFGTPVEGRPAVMTRGEREGLRRVEMEAEGKVGRVGGVRGRVLRRLEMDMGGN
ncbi:hypothetical protein FQN50_007221 [Emmonsiellopsis sp. PD_5]|nr:hypothetical protein FQN50_007221 [Emmonsiellopsis sp. PD_5]